jgi:hypothetical protein
MLSTSPGYARSAPGRLGGLVPETRRPHMVTAFPVPTGLAPLSPFSPALNPEDWYYQS